MSNHIYPFWRRAVEDGERSADLLANTVRIALLSTLKYEYDDGDEFLNDLSPPWSLPPMSIALKNKTFERVSEGMMFGADDAVCKSVYGSFDAFVIFIDTGVPYTSRLVCYEDERISGMPSRGDGGDVILSWQNGKIFTVSIAPRRKRHERHPSMR